MKITFETDGGFAAMPGLSRPFTIDTARSDAAVGQELVRLVHRARSEHHHRHGAHSQPGGDRQTYRIEIEDGDVIYTLEYLEPVTAPAGDELIGRLRTLARGEP